MVDPPRNQRRCRHLGGDGQDKGGCDPGEEVGGEDGRGGGGGVGDDRFEAADCV